jgi:hypothetical protein
VEGGKSDRVAANVQDRKRLLAAGWQPTLRSALLVWQRPNGHGGWHSQEVALEILDVLEDQTSHDGDRR